MASPVKRPLATPATPTPVLSRDNSKQQLAEQRASTAFSIANKLIKFLLQRGLGTDALFLEALSDSQSAEFKTLLKRLKDESLENSLELLEHTRHPQVVAQLLLEFLKELPEPLLTYQNYDSFIMTEYIKEKAYRAKYCAQLLSSSPPHHVALTTQLLTLLHRLVCSKSINHLSSELLAPLFAPHFLRPKKICQYMVDDEQFILNVMIRLIDDYELLFSGDGSGSTYGSTGSIKSRKISDSPYVTDLSTQTSVIPPKSETKGHKRSLSAIRQPSSLSHSNMSVDSRSDKEEDMTADDVSSNDSSPPATPRSGADPDDQYSSLFSKATSSSVSPAP